MERHASTPPAGSPRLPGTDPSPTRKQGGRGGQEIERESGHRAPARHPLTGAAPEGAKGDRSCRVAEDDQQLEPLHTIHQGKWCAGRERLEGLAGPERLALSDLLDHVEGAWPHLRDLQLLYETDRARARETDFYGQLLNFIDGDLVDVFRSVAIDTAALVPGWTGWREAIESLDDLDGDATLFARYADVLIMAVHHPDVPLHLRAAADRFGPVMLGWYAQFTTLLAAARAELDDSPAGALTTDPE